MLQFCIGVVVFLCFLKWLQRRRKFRKIVNGYPGPDYWPIIGNIMDWSNKPDQFFSTVRQYARKYMTTYRLWAGEFGSINVIIPEDVEIILLSPRQIKKSLLYNFLHPWLGEGLLTSTGNKWQQRRKILTPAFHFTILRRFVEIFGEHSERFVTELRTHCHEPEVNVIPLVTKFTLNTICETAMGTNLSSNGVKERQYVEAMYKLATVLLYRLLRPWYYYDFLFNLCPAGWNQLKLLKNLHGFTKTVIKDRQENFQDSDVSDLDQDDGFRCRKRLAMLDLLIDAKNNTGVIDDTGIREEVDTFMFEGHDTTAMALCFALMTLANNKDVQDNIFVELSSVFGTSNRQPTYNDLQNMKYLDMCLKECLRLYPSVPFISREMTEDLPLSTGVAPSGSVINIHIYDLHRNPNVFPNPEKFDPERFSPKNVQRRHPFSYVPFSAGPRNCIGQKFAMLEMKSIVSSIIRNYVLVPITTPEDINPIVDIVLRNKTAINVKFVERKSL